MPAAPVEITGISVGGSVGDSDSFAAAVAAAAAAALAAIHGGPSDGTSDGPSPGMAPQLPPSASPPAAARRHLSQQRSPSQQHSYSVSVSASTQNSPTTDDRDRASSARRDSGRLRRRLQVDSALGECTTITITYSAESDLESISDEIDSLSAQATSHHYPLRSTATDKLLLLTNAHVSTDSYSLPTTTTGDVGQRDPRRARGGD